jgi:hypothetical protein
MLPIICGSKPCIRVILRGYTFVGFNWGSWLWKRSRALHATVIVAPLNLQVGENDVRQAFKPVLEELAMEEGPKEADHDEEDGTSDNEEGTHGATYDGADTVSRGPPR